MTRRDELDPHLPAEQDYHEQLLVLEHMIAAGLSSQTISPADIAKINQLRAVQDSPTRRTEIVENQQTSQP